MSATKAQRHFVTRKGQKQFVTNKGPGKNCDQQRPGKKLWPAMSRKQNCGQQWPGKKICQLMSLPSPPEIKWSTPNINVKFFGSKSQCPNLAVSQCQCPYLNPSVPCQNFKKANVQCQNLPLPAPHILLRSNHDACFNAQLKFTPLEKWRKVGKIDILSLGVYTSS
jgi:hypothetical protein